MRLAICVRQLPARDIVDVGRFAEDHGYAEVFLPDGAHGGARDSDGRLSGRDAIPGFAAMFTATTSVRGTLGVAATPLHHRLALPTVAATLNEMSDGRFSLGLGVSHQEQTAHFGVAYPPDQVAYMRGWLRDLRAFSAGGMSYGGGWPVLLAALGPRMVQLGAEEADGLILNWLTPEHAAASVAAVRACAPAGTRPQVALYLRLMEEQVLRGDAEFYDGMANYHRHFVRQGLRSPADIVAGTTLPRHDLDAARARLEEYRDAGIDTVCLYPIGFDDGDRRALAALTR